MMYREEEEAEQDDWAAEQEEFLIEQGEEEVDDTLAKMEASVDYADEIVDSLPADLGRGFCGWWSSNPKHILYFSKIIKNSEKIAEN